MINTTGGPGWHRHSKVRRNYLKVFVALHYLGDDASTCCTASNRQIAEASGLSADTALSYIRSMEQDGLIAVFRQELLPRRLIVFLDNPAGLELIKQVKSALRLKDPWKLEDRIGHIFESIG